MTISLLLEISTSVPFDNDKVTETLALCQKLALSMRFKTDMEKFEVVHVEAGNGKNDITGIADGLMMTNVEH